MLAADTIGTVAVATEVTEIVARANAAILVFKFDFFLFPLVDNYIIIIDKDKTETNNPKISKFLKNFLKCCIFPLEQPLCAISYIVY